MSKEAQNWTTSREWQRVTPDQADLIDEWSERFDPFNSIAAAFLLTKSWETWTEAQKIKYFDVMEGLDVDQIEDKWEEVYADDE